MDQLTINKYPCKSYIIINHESAILRENIIEMNQKDYQKKWYMRKELKNEIIELLTQELRKVVSEKQWD